MSSSPASVVTAAPLVIGRYVLHSPIARGGMATIHIARLMGAEGFSRIVAAKRLHPEFTEDAEFVAMFLDEASIASKVHHPNVVPVLDVITTGTEIVLVQEYVHGVPLSSLMRAARKRDAPVSIPLLVTVMSGVLAGLHGAHEAKDELGQPLEIVHRDVSPQNVMVALDGTPRLLDFGVAKATLSAHVTRQGAFKGKIAYMAPEQLRGKATRASDLYAVGVMLWESIVGRRLHQGVTEAAMLTNIATSDAPSLSQALEDSRPLIPAERWEQVLALEPIVRRALLRDPDARFATAAQMEEALVGVVPRVPTAEVAAWTKDLGKEFLAGRDTLLAHEEVSWRRQHGNLESGSRLVIPRPIDEMGVSTADSQAGQSECAPSSCTSGGSSRVCVVPPTAPTSSSLPLRRPLVWLWSGLVLLAVAGVTRALLSGPREAAPVSAVVVDARLPPVVPAFVPPAPEPPRPAEPDPAPPRPAVAEVAHAAPVRFAWPVRARPAVAAPPHHGDPAPVVAAPSPSAAPATTGDTDCNPPFYFEGKKKLYKRHCI